MSSIGNRPSGEPAPTDSPAICGQRVREILIASLGPLVREKLGADSYGGGSLGDFRVLMSAMIERWPSFSVLLAANADNEAIRSHLYELRRTRDTLSHDKSFDADDAWRMADTARRLLEALRLLPAETAAGLRKIQSDLQSRTTEGGAELSALRAEYLAALATQLTYVDLGGITPTVGGQVVRVPLEAIFIAAPFEVLDILGRRHGHSGAEANGARTALVAKVGEASDALVAKVGEASDALEPGEVIPPTRLVGRQRAAIVGDPGSGKSTFGRFVARGLAVGHQWLEPAFGLTPVFIRAVDFANAMRHDDTMSLPRYLTDLHSDRFGTVIERDLASDSCYLVIDGLDEIGEPALRVRTAREVNLFASEFRRSRMLLTSREHGFRQSAIDAMFDVVRTRPFDSDEVVAFLRAWNTLVADPDPEASAQRLAEQIDRTPGVDELAGNPLLLTIIALAASRGAALPSRRVELYQMATATLLREWPLRQRGVDLEETDLLSVLEPIGLRMVSGLDEHLSEHQLMEILVETIGDFQGVPPAQANRMARAMLETIEDQTGVFVEKGVDEGVRHYAFIHRSFAEYFAARCLAGQWEDGKLDLSRWVHRAGFDETLRLMFAHLGTWGVAPATRALDGLLTLQSPLEAHLKRDLFLACRVLIDRVRPRPEVRNRILGEAARAAIGHPIGEVRAEALRMLSLIRDGGGLLLDESLVPKEPTGAEADIRRKVLAIAAAGQTGEVVREALHGLASVTDRAERHQLLHVIIDSILGPDPDGPEDWAIVVDQDVIRMPRSPADSLVALGVPVVTALSLVRGEDQLATSGAGPWVLDGRHARELDIESRFNLYSDEWSRWFATVDSGVVPTEGDLAFLARKALALGDDAPAAISLFQDYAPAFGGTLDDDAWLAFLAEVVPDGLKGPSAVVGFALRSASPRRPLIESAITSMVTSADATLVSFGCDLLGRLGTDVAPEAWNYVGLLFSDDKREDVRGAAARALLVADAWDRSPFALFGPWLTDPAINSSSGASGHIQLRGLLRVLARLEASSERRAVAEQIRALLLLPMPDPDPGEADYLPDGRPLPGDQPELRATLWPLLDHEDANVRQWAAVLWAAVTRGFGAPAEVARLLRDEDPRVRTAGVLSIEDADVQDPEWLMQLLPRLLVLGPKAAVEDLAYHIGAMADRLDDAVRCVQEELDTRPSNEVAFQFGQTIVLAQPDMNGPTP